MLDAHKHTSRPRLTLTSLAVWPSVVFVLVAGTLQLGGIDQLITQIFFDPLENVFPLKHNFWTEQIIHNGGRRVIISIATTALVAYLLSLQGKWLADYRRPLAYFLWVLVLSVLAANIGKALTNVDCPWDLVQYGGTRFQFGLFEDKPPVLPRGRCFPGGHRSSGFALFALYFIGRKYDFPRAWLSLLPATLFGGLFALGQWSRGAHFPSHDLTSAYICWMIALGCYVLVFRQRFTKDARLMSTIARFFH